MGIKTTRYCFSKNARLLCARDFRLCIKYGVKKRGHFLMLYVRQAAKLTQKLGLTVSKRYGNSTQRNRFKRLVREAFRLLQHDLPKKIHINISPLPTAHQACLEDIQEELRDIIQQNKEPGLCTKSS